VASVVLLVVGFMFSMVIFAVVVVVGLAAWGYFRWKTRELRQAMRAHPSHGHVIDGVVIVVDDPESARTARITDIQDK